MGVGGSVRVRAVGLPRLHARRQQLRVPLRKVLLQLTVEHGLVDICHSHI